MKLRILTGMLALLIAGALHAQQNKGISVEGGDPDDRASARLLYWDGKANSAAGQFAINYGRPVWRKAYDHPKTFDGMTDGKVWRMGSNFWTNLYTDVPASIAGKKISPGLYFLGLERAADGKAWRLAFIDPVKAQMVHLDAFDIRKAAVEFTAPMKQEPPSPTLVDKLTITLSHSENEMRDGTLKVAWGHLVLTAPVHVMVAQ